MANYNCLPNRTCPDLPGQVKALLSQRPVSTCPDLPGQVKTLLSQRPVFTGPVRPAYTECEVN